MRALIRKSVNLRLERPSVNSQVAKVINQGEVVNLKSGIPVTGDQYNNSSEWLELEEGGFIVREAIANINKLSNHLVGLGAEEIWKLGYTGKSTKVAVLDTGINSELFKAHIDFDLTEKFLRQHVNDTSWGFEDEDALAVSHGTSVAGLISGPQINGYQTALAPESQLVILKIARNHLSPESRYIKKAMRFCLQEDEIKIINMSYNFALKDPTFLGWYREFESLVKNSGKVLIVSSGNSPEAHFPATDPRVISAGARIISEGHHWPSSPSENTYYMPGSSIKSVNRLANPLFLDKGGTSYSAAFLSAAMAILSQAIGYREDDLVSKLKKVIDLSAETHAWGKSINLLKAINNLNQIS